MGDEGVPDEGLEGLDQRRAQGGRGREHYRQVGELRERAAGGADDAIDRRAERVGGLDREDEVERDVVLARAAADGEDEERVAGRQPRDLEPRAEGGLPAIVVR